MMRIAEHDFILMNYYGMSFRKVVMIGGFLIPYLAVRFSSDNQQSSP